MNGRHATVKVIEKSRAYGHSRVRAGKHTHPYAPTPEGVLFFCVQPFFRRMVILKACNSGCWRSARACQSKLGLLKSSRGTVGNALANSSLEEIVSSGHHVYFLVYGQEEPTQEIVRASVGKLTSTLKASTAWSTLKKISPDTGLHLPERIVDVAALIRSREAPQDVNLVLLSVRQT